MSSKLTELSPIFVDGKYLPQPQLLSYIPILHDILGDVLQDWLRAVEPYQSQIDNAVDDSARLYAVSSGFMELQRPFLKSLFSYAFFFVAIDQAYDHLYEELNDANFLSGLNLKHSKNPQKSSFVKKICTIRNSSIAHFPSEKPTVIDGFAAMSWQPTALSWKPGDPPDLEKLTFVLGCFRGTDSRGHKVESQDLEVSGIKTMHYDHCLPYLERYDKVCYEYLSSLNAALSQTTS